MSSRKSIGIGARFGRLTVIESAGRNGHGRFLVKAKCDCGSEVRCAENNLRNGHTQSCGCISRERLSRMAQVTSFVHGHARHGRVSPEYRSWVCMITRCTDPDHKSYRHYGGRGITICQRWRDSFEAFLADMGPRPHKHTIDRINVDGNYEPSNCRWADAIAQRNNRRVAEHQ